MQREKIAPILENLGFELSKKEMEEVYYRLDPRKLGSVPIPKLEELILEYLTTYNHDECREALTQMSLDSETKIQKEDFLYLLNKVGEPLS